ncbi:MULTISPECIES: hypothetical protein [Streptomyces]|uniref:hypothetical protein n=1 Tax=Streptomyces TaxID=1883 RepID=UPI0035E2A0A0
MLLRRAQPPYGRRSPEAPAPGPGRAGGSLSASDGPTITVHGPSPLTATRAAGHDIRAAALVIAALAAEGISAIEGIYHLQRGYGTLLPTLSALGAELEVVQE